MFAHPLLWAAGNPFEAERTAMKFIEMSGRTLFKIVSTKEAEPLHKAGVTENCLLRVNMQGDIEIRRPNEWGIIGGLLGDFEGRVKEATGLDWA
jgi:hypothetical protein